jgi:hypothetical protein
MEEQDYLSLISQLSFRLQLSEIRSDWVLAPVFYRYL